MPRTRRRARSPAAPVQEAAVSKPKRQMPAVKWDHRKDKYMLLAIFAQMNTRTPNFTQLSDVLGSEIYSPSALSRRFRHLKQMADEVLEDRQRRDEEISYPMKRYPNVKIPPKTTGTLQSSSQTHLFERQYQILIRLLPPNAQVKLVPSIPL
ncbi:hypothetical protein BDW59DRAFT_164112 [Aspergillus cavernicola]|uniref:Uncharacterized protein n=1 Tax=Aspergillus cavernicola TaxID=176166 RepID=A0ABR4I373_9EURO